MLPRSLLVLAAVLGMAVGAHAQSQTAPAAADVPGSKPESESPSLAPAATAEKKVWTNEDVSDLRASSTISTVGSSETRPPAKASSAAKSKNPRQFQAQIAQLERQVPQLDQQIAELQDAINGKPTGDAKTSTRPRNVQADDWNVQVENLEKKKQGILDQIATLKDEARHQGVPPNTLP
jgi:chaperonin cofactor prefoldin